MNFLDNPKKIPDNLKKIIVISILGCVVLSPESVLSEDSSEPEVPALESDLPESENRKAKLDLSLSYNSFNEEQGWAGHLWGRPFRDKLYLGMWTLHFEPGDDQETNNELLGVAYKGHYGGTFINTHGDRVWSGGWQRTLFQKKYGDVEVEAGYRTGIMYGYKKYLQLGNSRFFPLFQTLLDIEYKNFGVELSWAGVVFTAGFYYCF